MADLVEELITTIAQNVFGTLQIEHANGRKINLQRPWRRVGIAELVHERTGWKFDKRPLQEAMPQLLSNPDLASVRGRLNANLSSRATYFRSTKNSSSTHWSIPVSSRTSHR